MVRLSVNGNGEARLEQNHYFSVRLFKYVNNGKRMARSRQKVLTAYPSVQGRCKTAKATDHFIFRKVASPKARWLRLIPQKVICSGRSGNREVVALSKPHSANKNVNADTENCRTFYGRAARDFAIKSTPVFGAGYVSR